MDGDKDVSAAGVASTASGRFAIVPARVVDDRRVTLNAFRVFSALGSYGDIEGWCWPSHETLSRRTGIAETRVRQSLRLLERLGYIERHQRRAESGLSMTNRYRILFDGPLPSEQLLNGMGGRGSESVPPGTPNDQVGKRPPNEGVPTNTVPSGTTPVPKKNTAPSGADSRRRETDDRVAPILKAFCEEHRKVMGMAYAVVGGRDAMAIKRLPPDYTTEKLAEVVRRYFADPFTRRTAATVPSMTQRAAALLLSKNGATGPPPRPMNARTAASAQPAELPAGYETITEDRHDEERHD